MLGDPSGFICPMKFTVDSTLYEVKGRPLMMSHHFERHSHQSYEMWQKCKKCLECVTSKFLKKGTLVDS